MKGILFKPNMIRAIQEGRKTITRRLDSLKEINQKPDRWEYKQIDGIYWLRDKKFTNSISLTRVKPYYRVDEVVYIKEAWWTPPSNRTDTHHQSIVSYRAIIVENAGEDAAKKNMWLSPLFMLAWAARTFIQITDVRPEKLQEITEEDAIAEGMESDNEVPPAMLYSFTWDSINPKNPWSSNPWVWRYEFRKVEKPLDLLQEK